MTIYEKLTLAIQNQEVTSTLIEQFAAQIRQDAVEEALRSLPFVVKNLIATIGNMQEVSTKFYDKHKDLATHKSFVSKIIEELEHKHPGLSVEKIADLAAVEAKQRLTRMADINVTGDVSVDKSTLSDRLSSIIGDN